MITNLQIALLLIFLLFAWVGNACLTAAIVIGEFSGEFPEQVNYSWYRGHLGFGLLIGAIPVLPPVLYTFMTGFWRHGLAFTYQQAVSIASHTGDSQK